MSCGWDTIPAAGATQNGNRVAGSYRTPSLEKAIPCQGGPRCVKPSQGSCLPLPPARLASPPSLPSPSGRCERAATAFLSSPNPRPSLLASPGDPRQPLHSRLPSMPLRKEQMDSLTSYMLLPGSGNGKWAPRRTWHITPREFQTLCQKVADVQKMC